MKLEKLFFATVLSGLVFTACVDNDDKSEWNDGSQPISFTSSIKGVNTRAVDSEWTAGDKIGVFMKAADGDLASAIAVNKQHVTDANGNVSAADADNALYYPTNGNSVDFIAYYPYTASLTGNVYKVNVADQSKPENIDLLYSDNATGFAKGTTSKPQLQFAHQLSQIVFNITKDATVPSLNGLTVTFDKMNTTADFALADGTLSNAGTAAKIAAVVDEAAATAKTIALPAAALADVKVVFNLNGKTFTADYPQTELLAGRKYTHNVKLSDSNGQPVIVMDAATIEDWIEVAGGDIDVDFGDGTDVPEPGKEEVIFFETCGDAQPLGSTKVKINDYTGWDNPNLTFHDRFAGEYQNGDVRATSTTTNNVWLPAYTTTIEKPAALRISGFDVANYTNLKLSYSIAANSASNQNIIKVDCGGTMMTVPDGAITTGNKYQTVELDVPDGISYIEFISDAANTVGFRIDSIKLVGTGK